jgi:bifunctional DNA-binding transcriptional regulator/antitoxin component of YhaV-PrlF toxin-antitoxin module
MTKANVRRFCGAVKVDERRQIIIPEDARGDFEIETGIAAVC